MATAAVSDNALPCTRWGARAGKEQQHIDGKRSMQATAAVHFWWLIKQALLSLQAGTVCKHPSNLNDPKGRRRKRGSFTVHNTGGFWHAETYQACTLEAPWVCQCMFSGAQEWRVAVHTSHADNTRPACKMKTRRQLCCSHGSWLGSCRTGCSKTVHYTGAGHTACTKPSTCGMQKFVVCTGERQASHL